MILKNSLFFTGACWLFALGGLAVTLISTPMVASRPPESDPSWAIWFLGLILLIPGGLGVLAAERVHVSDEQVKKAGPFFKRCEMRWREVIFVPIDRMGTLTLVSTNGTRIEIYASYVGIGDFVDLLPRRLPREVWQEVEPDFYEYHRFIHG